MLVVGAYLGGWMSSEWKREREERQQEEMMNAMTNIMRAPNPAVPIRPNEGMEEYMDRVNGVSMEE